MNLFGRRAKSAFCFIVAIDLFFSQCIFAHVIESQFFQSRSSRFVSRANSTSSHPLAVPFIFPKQETALDETLNRIPYRLGIVHGAYSSSQDNRPVVLHIQDVHVNLDAQRKIGQTVEWLIRQGSVGQLGLEGAFDTINFSPFWSFSHQQLLMAVANSLLEQHEISGPVYSFLTAKSRFAIDSLLSNHPMTIIGVDNKASYRRNVEAYRASIKSVSLVSAKLDELEKITQREVSLLNPSLREWVDARSQFWKSQRSLGRYALDLKKWTEDQENFFPTFEAYVAAVCLENDLKPFLVERDRNEFLRLLSQKLTAHEANSLLSLTVAFRSQDISSTQYYRTLKTLAEKKHIPLSKTPQFERYVQYILLTESIKGETLIDEMAQQEKWVTEFLSTNEQEKNVVLRLRHIYLSQKLVRFSLSSDEWGELKRQARLLPQLLSFEEFYRAAEERDKFMAQSLMRSAPPDALTVVVAGGFHASGLKQALEEQGYRYVSFVPRLSSVDSRDGADSLTSFAQDQMPLDQFFGGEKLFLAANPFGPGVIGVACHVAALMGALNQGQPDEIYRTFTGQTFAARQTRIDAQWRPDGYEGNLYRNNSALRFSGQVLSWAPLRTKNLGFSNPAQQDPGRILSSLRKTKLLDILTSTIRLMNVLQRMEKNLFVQVRHSDESRDLVRQAAFEKEFKTWVPIFALITSFPTQTSRLIDRWWFRSVVVPIVELPMLPGLAMFFSTAMAQPWACFWAGMVLAILHGLTWPKREEGPSTIQYFWSAISSIVRHPVHSYSGQSANQFFVRLFVSVCISLMYFDPFFVAGMVRIWPNPIGDWLLQYPITIVLILHGVWNHVVKPQYALNLSVNEELLGDDEKNLGSQEKPINPAPINSQGHEIRVRELNWPPGSVLAGSGIIHVVIGANAAIDLDWTGPVGSVSSKEKYEKKLKSAFKIWGQYLTWLRLKKFESIHDQVFGLRHSNRSIEFDIVVDPDDHLDISSPGGYRFVIDDEFFKLPKVFRALLLNHEAQPNEFFALYEDVRFYKWLIGQPKIKGIVKQAYKKGHLDLLNLPFFEFLEKAGKLSDQQDIERLISLFMINETLAVARRLGPSIHLKSAYKIIDFMADRIMALATHGRVDVNASSVRHQLLSLFSTTNERSLQNKQRRLHKLFKKIISNINTNTHDFEPAVISELNLMVSEVRAMSSQNGALGKKPISTTYHKLGGPSFSPGALGFWFTLGFKSVRLIGLIEGVLVSAIQLGFWVYVGQDPSVIFFIGTAFFWLLFGFWAHYYGGIFDPLRGEVVQAPLRSMWAGFVFASATLAPVFMMLANHWGLLPVWASFVSMGLSGALHAALNMALAKINLWRTQQFIAKRITEIYEKTAHDSSEVTEQRLISLISETNLIKHVRMIDRRMIGERKLMASGDPIGDVAQSLLLILSSNYRDSIYTLSRILGAIIEGDRECFGGTYDMFWTLIEELPNPQALYIFLPKDQNTKILLILQQISVAEHHRHKGQSLLVFVTQDQNDIQKYSSAPALQRFRNLLFVQQQNTFIETERCALQQADQKFSVSHRQTRLIFPTDHDFPQGFFTDDDLLRVKLYRLLTETLNPLMIEIRFGSHRIALQNA